MARNVLQSRGSWKTASNSEEHASRSTCSRDRVSLWILKLFLIADFYIHSLLVRHTVLQVPHGSQPPDPSKALPWLKASKNWTACLDSTLTKPHLTSAWAQLPFILTTIIRGRVLLTRQVEPSFVIILVDQGLVITVMIRVNIVCGSMHTVFFVIQDK